MRVSVLSSRRVHVSPLTLLVLVVVLLSLLQACVAQYYSSSGDYFSSGDYSSGEGSSGDYSSSAPFDSSSESPFSSSSDTPYSSTADMSSSAGGSSTADMSSSAGASSDSSAGSSGSSGGDSSASSAASGASSSRSTTSAPKASGPKQPTSAPHTSAPVRGLSSSTGGNGCATSPITSLTLSDNGLQFIRGGEAFAPFFYLDTVSKATIGFGHNCAAKQNCNVSPYTNGYLTLDQANSILSTDAQTAQTRAKQQINSNAVLTQNQFNVLVDQAFNFGSVPASMVRFVNGYNGQAIPLQKFHDAVAAVTGSNAQRVSQEAAYSLSCGTPSYSYRQANGQYCASGSNTGLCLDTTLYSCAGGSFISGTTGCRSDPGTIECCAIPTPSGQQNTVKLTVTKGSDSSGMPSSFNGAQVNPATFNSNGARRR